MPEVRLQRRIPAVPARVYRAWLDPAVMVRWFAPAAFTVGRAEADARVGGRLRVWHRDDEQDMGGAEAEIVELEPERRIALRWWWVGPERTIEPAEETRLTLTFEPSGTDGTLLTLVHDRLDGLTAAHPEITDGIEPGWTQALDSLTTELESTS